ncbi:hypothetical protein [Calderihabitans maritimus]|uniref:Suppressed phage shock protein A n=1 Tax=Calderihabitans maritimus TaxID=1246530 RepID=A0A1Z5HWM6_9FIRM|nr:hypothetical protein [Calderihabitans maritimus]GAW93680.1 suppressed phage shock protein A [Calderihabitans maritimus]
MKDNRYVEIAGNLCSLTDLLKQKLYYSCGEGLTNLVEWVHSKMLRDYLPEKVEETVLTCLQNNPCFKQGEDNLWYLNKEGNKDNDWVYKLLQKAKKPLSIEELAGKGARGGKGKKQLIKNMKLSSDGRFIQLENGKWVLADWRLLKEIRDKDVDKIYELIQQCKCPVSLREVAQQLFNLNLEETNMWEKLENNERFIWIDEDRWFLKELLLPEKNNKTPYLKHLKEMRILPDIALQQEKWEKERAALTREVNELKASLEEAHKAREEAAATLAQQIAMGNHLKLLQRQKEKLEAKAASILRQCRLWVDRARRLEEEKAGYEETINGLQQEINKLYQKMERLRQEAEDRQTRLQAELNDISGELAKVLRSNHQLELALDAAQETKKKLEETVHKLKSKTRHPLVRWTLYILTWWERLWGIK